jgi:hypothetical protein
MDVDDELAVDAALVVAGPGLVDGCRRPGPEMPPEKKKP